MYLHTFRIWRVDTFKINVADKLYHIFFSKNFLCAFMNYWHRFFSKSWMYQETWPPIWCCHITLGPTTLHASQTRLCKSWSKNMFDWRGIWPLTSYFRNWHLGDPTRQWKNRPKCSPKHFSSKLITSTDQKIAQLYYSSSKYSTSL
jgi:hypothetical protein